jgi:hypothetical protein
MAKALDWAKARRRVLGNRAAFPEFSDHQSLFATPRDLRSSLQEIKAEIRKLEKRPAGPTRSRPRRNLCVACDECGHQGMVQIELASAMTQRWKCECGHRQFLTLHDLKKLFD